MRTKSGRWSFTRGPLTYSANMEAAGITADFAGGFVHVDAIVLEANPTAGNWVMLQAMVDGVAQGPTRTIWQATGQNNVQISLGHSVRVPPGRHHVGVQLSSSNATAWAANGAFIEVTEPPT
jgi:hypothetical protein